MYSRSIRLAAALGLAVGLQACAQSQDAMDGLQTAVHEFNPFGTAKKPLPGERKALFPEGVPGVQQGIPAELQRGHQPEVVAATPEPTAEPAKPERPKARPRPVKTTTAPPAERPQKAQRPARRPVTEPPADGVWPPPPAAQASPPARPAPQAAPPPAPTAPAATAPGGWQAPASQPLPTVWPDPPKAQ